MLSVLLAGLLISPAYAINDALENSSAWEQRLDVNWLNGISVRTPSDSTYNPDNTVFEIERYASRTDLNLDYRVIYKSRHKLVLRPRAYSQYSNVLYQNTDPPSQVGRDRGKLDLTEAFAETSLGEEFSVTLGLQNYQWGPAEIISPSNPLFHFNRDQRSVLWKEKGRALARLNWTPDPNVSFVLISEPVDNLEPRFISGQDFHSKGLLKIERRSEREAQDYFGFVFGTEEQSKVFAGSYLNYKATEGFSLYSDFRFIQYGFVYTPQSTNGIVYNMQEDSRYDPTWHHLGVYGVRYEAADWDLRCEVIANSRGYTKQDFLNGLGSGSPLNPLSAVNADRMAHSGLELYGKNYGYVSLRIPDRGDEKQWQFAFRYLHSGMDGSGVFSTVIERTLSDHFVAVTEGRQSFGAKDSEFTLQEKTFVFLGLKTLW